MYFSRERSVEWSEAVADIVREHRATAAGAATVFVIPSFLAVEAVGRALGDSGVLLGAQDMYWEDGGAFTGEVSGPQIRELGAVLVEIGHAERRALFGETDDTVALKVAAAWRNGLTPVLCIGEVAEQDPRSAAIECRTQLSASLSAAREAGLTGDLVVAYEPVWAIGAAEPAGADHIRAVCASLGEQVADDPAVGEHRVIYGGSAGPGLLPGIADSVDGMFLGRFAHDPEAVRLILDEIAGIARIGEPTA
ncbi:triosephosphate isomerase [Mycetocola reblochoni]|nr:triosephosphate isomerase [Mycetocola reblochoni]